MLTKSVILKFYKQPEMQKEIVEHAQNKEVGIRYGDQFGRRPDILSYPRDILELALQGATSVHASEELWSNPLALQSSLNRKELDQLRTGWDLVLDIDCAIMEYSRICADLVVKFLKYCEVKNISVKFSGNKGFHVGVPFEAFPKEISGKLTRDLFPEAPKKIAFYIKENIKEELGRRILQFEQNNFNDISKKVNVDKEKIKMAVKHRDSRWGEQEIETLDVEPFLAIDTVLISSRHLYRMPYSMHEKSGLVSLPIDPDQVLKFEKFMASPEKIIAPMFKFLDRKIETESASRLLLQAYDFEVKSTEEKSAREFEETTISSPVKEDFFPPCMKLLLQGLDDGKKRGIFCLTNFLGKIGWNKTEIELLIINWNNEKNREPLRTVYIKGQMSSFKPGERLPPNCSNEAYYLGIRICQPDGLCKRIKNPVNYTLLRWKSWLREREDNKDKT